MEKIKELFNQEHALEGDITALKAEIEQTKAELDKGGGTDEALKIEIEKLETQCGALEILFEDMKSGKLEK